MDKNLTHLLKPEIYLCKINSPVSDDIFFRLFSILNNEEKERILKKKSRKNAELSLIGNLLAKTAIKNCANIPIKEQKFILAEHGKPCLDGFCGVHFSISHSKDYAVCAVFGSPVGIDIEKIRSCPQTLMKKVCSPEELDFLLKSENQDSGFIKLWSQKEAAIKKSGGCIALSKLKSCNKEKNINSIKIDGYWLSVCY